MKKEEEILKHPSYGLIRFSRIHGRSDNFYGSELAQQNYITLEIHESYLKRDLTNDTFYQGLPIVKLSLTSAQFSELITSLNTGSGVPCTLEYIQGEKVEKEKNKENRKEFVHRKFKERMRDFSQQLVEKSDDVKKLLEKQKLSKEDKNQIQWIIESAIQEIKSNIPFFLECFQEDADKLVMEAKMEVENAIMHKITSIGLEQLKNEQLKLKD